VSDPVKLTALGQSFFDDPVWAHPAKHLTTRIADSCAEAFGHVFWTHEQDGMVRRHRRDLPQKLLLGHERTQLRWMEPDGNGGLMPKAPQ
jgi:hypothetical protein